MFCNYCLPSISVFIFVLGFFRSFFFFSLCFLFICLSNNIKSPSLLSPRPLPYFVLPISYSVFLDTKGVCVGGWVCASLPPSPTQNAHTENDRVFFFRCFFFSFFFFFACLFILFCFFWGVLLFLPLLCREFCIVCSVSLSLSLSTTTLRLRS